MALRRFPSEQADRFQVRLPDGLRDQIRADAERNGRSMNSEIVARLSATPSPVQDLRDWFAGQALPVMFTLGTEGAIAGKLHPDGVAVATVRASYELADAMMAERAKRETV